MQEAGAEVVLLVAVVDRGGTVEAMAAAEGIPFRAVLTAPDLGLPLRGRPERRSVSAARRGEPGTDRALAEKVIALGCFRL